MAKSLNLRRFRPFAILLVLIYYHPTHVIVDCAILPPSEVPPPPSDILSSPRVTDWGEWGDWKYCPEDTFVMGMRLKTEPAQGPGDDTALNGVSFLCGVIGETQKILHSTNRQIQSSSGKWGTWGVSYECPESYAVGFQLRSEPSQKGHDDTAANNLRMFCSDNYDRININYLEGSGLGWGDWTEPQICSPGWAMCGLRTQVESAKGHGGDDTSLNNLDVQCCKVP